MSIKTALKVAACAAFSFALSLGAQAQKPALDHSVYDSWHSLTRPVIPLNGEWVVYTVSPQQGDAVLYLRKYDGSVSYACPRAYDHKISADGTKAVYKIRPLYEQTRKAKIAKKKPDQMPHDSLAVIDLATGDVEKIANLKSLVVPFSLGDYVVYTKIVDKKDSLLKKEDHIILNIKTMSQDTIHFASNLKFNPRGSLLAYDVKPAAKDSVLQAGVYLYSSAGVDTLFRTDKKATLGSIFWNEAGDQFAFYANADTTKDAKKYTDVYLWAEESVRKVADHADPAIPEGWKLSDKPSIGWRKGDSMLTLGTCPIPMEKDTSIVDFERPKLDIWVWNEDYIQPVQKMRAGREKDRTYLAVLDLVSGKMTQIADEAVPDVGIGVDYLGDVVIASTDKPYRVQQQWDMNPCADWYRVSLSDGSRKLIAEAAPWTRFTLSPDGTRAVLYDAVARKWLFYDIANDSFRDLTSALGVSFYDENDDHPCLPPPAGSANWFTDSRRVTIRDMYDYWVFDAEGVKAPWLLTEGKGRADSTVYSLTIPYDEPHYFGRGTYVDPSRPLWFITRDTDSKQWGVASRDLTRRRNAVRVLAKGECKYDMLTLSSAGKEPVLYFTRESFETGRDLWRSTDLFKSEERVTEINPQIKDYNWGTVELMKWDRSDGIKAEALLFKPEDFDPAKKYPVIFYFYEKNSQTLYDARVPAPSRSVVNIPYFVSNGYVVCVPDMYYKMDGHPGRDGLESVLSAADEVCRNPWADEKHMGIQGQSWGGYQVAYIITQTDRFAAAGAGAPVSNMTSAYGGIRWGTGLARTFQYEQQQSRIGKDLWSGFDLYYDNSPLFFVPNVTTPVLIMHNDNDGAVPWWQGIEFFNGLRRCGKQAWLLQYNGEAHNLNGRWNSKDLSVRLQQFFDCFLKEEPMPEWMSTGVPATKKGLTLGY